MLLCLESSGRRTTMLVVDGSMETWLMSPERPEETSRADPVTVLERAREQEGLDLSSLTAVAVTLGPGRYTGLRVGLALAQGLAAPRDLAVFGYDMTRVLARTWMRSHPDFSGELGICVDARGQSVILASWHIDGVTMTPGMPARCRPVADVDRPWGPDTPVAGSGCALVGFDGIALEPDALALADLWKEGHRPAVSATDLMPVYARDPV